MSFQVSISQRAKRDISEIANWIKQHSHRGGVSWLNALESAIRRIGTSPMSCVPAAEADDFEADLRQITFKTRRGNPFRLVFLVREEVVNILAVRGAGQDLLHIDDIVIPGEASQSELGTEGSE